MGKEFNELLEKLKYLSIEQKESDWAENLPEDIWNEHFKGKFKPLKLGFDIDRHRWYETSVTVVEVYGKPLGIRSITNVFSESSSVEDCSFTLEFFEMKEVSVISYEAV